MKKSKHFYNYTSNTSKEAPHEIKCLPEPLNKLWEKYKDNFVTYYECACYYGDLKNCINHPGWTIGTYLPRKDNSKNFRFILQFNYRPDYKFDKLYVQVYHCNRHEPTLSFEVDEKLAVSQVDEEFFEYLLKHRNAPHKKMKVICDKLNKIIENKNKLAKIESDF